MTGSRCGTASLVVSMLAASVVVVLSAPTARATPEAETSATLPWVPQGGVVRLPDGPVIEPPWALREVRAAREIVRLVFTDGERTTTVEVAAHDGDEGYWQTRHYRVQPAPGSQPPRDLLEAVMEGVRRLDRPGHEPVVRLVEKVRGPGGRLVERRTLAEAAEEGLEGLEERHLVLGADALAVLLLLGVGLAWLRREDRSWRRRLVVGAAVGAGLVAGLAALVQPGDIPVHWITILHEGDTRLNVDHLYGAGGHRGLHHHIVLDQVRSGAGASLRAAVRLHLLLWAAAGAVFFLIAWRYLGRAAHALAVALLFLLNPISLQAALSETPSALLGLLFVMALPPMALLARREAFGAVAATTAAFLVALLGLLAGMTRVESAILFAPALLLALVRAVAGAGPLRRIHERIVGWLRGALEPGDTRRRVVLGLVLVALTAASVLVEPSERRKWVWDAVDPVNWTALMLPVVVLRALPATVTLLALVGFVAGLRRWAAIGLLPITTVVLFRLYYSAAHASEYEILRYTTMVMPAVMVMVLMGWRATARSVERLREPRSRRIALAALAVGLFVGLPMPERGGPHAAPFDEADEVLLSRNRQVAARLLLHSVEAHPDCTFVTPTQHGDWIAFGVPVPEPTVVASPAREDVADAVGPTGCLLLWEGLDCNLVHHGADCGFLAEAGERLDVRTFPSRHYLHPVHGTHQDEVRLGVYRTPSERHHGR